MSEKLICYVASPVKNILELFEYRPEGYERVVKLAEMGCQEIKKRGFIPLSPVLSFLRAYREESERDEALEDGLTLLSRCHCFYEVKSAYKSEGVKRERKVAQELGLQILD